MGCTLPEEVFCGCKLYVYGMECLDYSLVVCEEVRVKTYTLPNSIYRSGLLQQQLNIEKYIKTQEHILNEWGNELNSLALY